MKRKRDHDNVPLHQSMLVTDYLSQHNVAVLLQVQDTPDLAPAAYYLFPRMKNLKGLGIANADCFEAATTAAFQVSKNGLEDCFQ